MWKKGITSETAISERFSYNFTEKVTHRGHFFQVK